MGKFCGLTQNSAFRGKLVPSNAEYGLLAAYEVSQSGLWLKLVGLVQRSVAVCCHAVFIG